MDRVLLVAGAVAVAGVVVMLVGRRRSPAPVVATGRVPHRVDRADFHRPDAPWLVAVFTASTCDTCAGVWRRAAVLESDEVAVQEVEHSRDRRLHDRYRIDALPTLVVADAAGEVRRAFLGPLTATDLRAAVAETRDPGSVPPAGDHGRGDGA